MSMYACQHVPKKKHCAHVAEHSVSRCHACVLLRVLLCPLRRVFLRYTLDVC